MSAALWYLAGLLTLPTIALLWLLLGALLGPGEFRVWVKRDGETKWEREWKR